VKLDEGEVKVRFVDYGTETWCRVDDLRKQLYMTEYPIQSITVKLKKIQPWEGDKWTESALEHLHRTVVDQVVKVEVTELGSSLPLEARVTTMTGQHIAEFLLNNKHARKVEENNNC